MVAKLSKGFVGGYEFDLLLIAISVSLLLTGVGRISVEWNILRGNCFLEKKKLYFNKKKTATQKSLEK